jgi:hypothetical protein
MNTKIETSSESVQASIKALAARFAEKHNLNPIVIESLSTGVIDRINIFGIENFSNLDKGKKTTFIEIAVADYFKCAKAFHDRYINEVAFRKTVQESVYNQLAEK